MTACIQTVKKFSQETGLSQTKIRELIRQKVIPEVPRTADESMQLINCTLLEWKLRSNLIEIPLSERSQKRTNVAPLRPKVV